MNATMKAYQAMTRAAADVEAGKKGAKTRLLAAKKRYLGLVEKTAKKDAAEKVATAKKRAAKISGVKAKKKTTATTKRKKTTTRKRTTTTRRARR